MMMTYVYHFVPCKFFTLALVGGLSLESEWHQVFSSLPDSTQYSDLSQHYCSPEGSDFSSDFQFLKFFFQQFGDRSKSTSNYSYHCHSHVPQLSLFPGKVQVFVYLCAFMDYILRSIRTAKSTRCQVIFLLLISTLSDLLVGIR